MNDRMWRPSRLPTSGWMLATDFTMVHRVQVGARKVPYWYGSAYIAVCGEASLPALPSKIEGRRRCEFCANARPPPARLAGRFQLTGAGR